MPDDGDAPRLYAALVALDPQDSGATTVQEWIDAADPNVFPGNPTDSHTATVAFGAVAFGTPVTNGADYPILVCATFAVASATAGIITMGVGPTGTPTTDTIVPAFTTAVLQIITVSAYVPSGFTFSLAHSGTISVGTPAVVVTAL